MKIYQELARCFDALSNCIKEQNAVWAEKWEQGIEDIMASAPSGSGIDSGTIINLSDSTSDKLIFNCGFHHMNENGMYDGWTEHKIIVTPSLALDFHLKITGKDRNCIKDYLSEVYCSWLDSDVN